MSVLLCSKVVGNIVIIYSGDKSQKRDDPPITPSSAISGHRLHLVPKIPQMMSRNMKINPSSNVGINDEAYNTCTGTGDGNNREKMKIERTISNY